MKGQEGDSIFAALYRNGIRSIATTRKRHQPLGLSGSYVSGLLARVNGIPNVRVDCAPLECGATITQQNCWPTTQFDLLGLARFIPARFVYGGFEQSSLFPDSTRLFQWWERLMAYLAGVANLPDDSYSPVPTGERIKVDVLVVGGGPTGIAAANGAAAQGKIVALVNRSEQPGRFARTAGARIPILDSSIQFFGGYDVFGAYRAGKLIAAAPFNHKGHSLVFDARELVVATGGVSVPPMVPGAWLPGVLDLRTALSLVVDYGIELGRRVAVFGEGDENSATRRLSDLGVNVVHTGAASTLRSIRGRSAVTGIKTTQGIACDVVVHAGPWRQNNALLFQASATGLLQLGAGLPQDNVCNAVAHQEMGEISPPALHPSALICPCMDVTAGEVLWRIAQGHTDLEVLKRLTSCGMGPCQGSPCWEHLATLVARAAPDAPQAVARPTQRAPRRSITVAQAAGMDGLVEPDIW